MEKVNQKMPTFSSMASSLKYGCLNKKDSHNRTNIIILSFFLHSSGEEKYILEIAQSLRHEILQSLQKIDAIG